MMRGVLPERAIEVIHTDRLGRFDKGLFAIDAIGHEELMACAGDVARQVVKALEE
jgi:hypothetical protein